VFDINDSYININSQKNQGVDVTFRMTHDFGNDWIFSMQAVMTWQTTDAISLFTGFEEDLNGEVGEPKWVGDFRFNLDKGPWNFFYSIDVVGSADSRPDWFESTFGLDWQDQLSSGAISQADLDDALCPTFQSFDLAPTCLDLTVPATFYHSASVTRELNDRFEITLGMTNIFDTPPPRASQTGGDGITQFGVGVFTSQYDLTGRRVFANVKAKF
jgi:iron complex outermembrane receptor protein